MNAGPCVEFLWNPRGDSPYVNAARSAEARQIARRIATMVNNQEAIVTEKADGEPRLRPARKGDIVLLFRAMTNVELYEEALREHGLDYYLVGGRAFFAQQEIYDLLNLLRSLENPRDEVALVGTLRAPFCCLSDEAVFLVHFYGVEINCAHGPEFGEPGRLQSAVELHIAGVGDAGDVAEDRFRDL